MVHMFFENSRAFFFILLLLLSVQNTSHMQKLHTVRYTPPDTPKTRKQNNKKNDIENMTAYDGNIVTMAIVGVR